MRHGIKKIAVEKKCSQLVIFLDEIKKFAL